MAEPTLDSGDTETRERANDDYRITTLCFGLTATGVVLDKVLGPHIMIEALLYSAFFIALTVSSRYTYLKPYSRAARTVIIALSVPGWYLSCLGAIALSRAT